MNHPLSLALALALAAIAPAHAQPVQDGAAQDSAAKPQAAPPGIDQSGAAMPTPTDTPTDRQAQANPFLVISPLPLHYPQFDKIRDDDFAPAFDRGMAENLKEVEAIANNPDPPTFENTIVALEKSGQLLNRATTVFFNLVGADTNDTRKKLQADYAARFAAHGDAISLNPKLFERISKLYDTRQSQGLDAQAVRLIQRYRTDFVRAGAKLSEKDKVRLREINSELAALGTKFSQNVLAEVNDSAVVIDTKAGLDGLTDEQIAAAAEAAKTRKLEGK